MYQNTRDLSNVFEGSLFGALHVLKPRCRQVIVPSVGSSFQDTFNGKSINSLYFVETLHDASFRLVWTFTVWFPYDALSDKKSRVRKVNLVSNFNVSKL